MAGGKPKFAQITKEVNQNLLKLQGGKLKFSQITWDLKLHGIKFSMKVQNQKIYILQNENQKKYLHNGKPKIIHITEGKTF
jgi:hypothetical protein